MGILDGLRQSVEETTDAGIEKYLKKKAADPTKVNAYWEGEIRKREQRRLEAARPPALPGGLGNAADESAVAGAFKDQRCRKFYDAHRLEGEIALASLGLVIEYAILTNYRLLFADASGKIRRKNSVVVSIPLDKIICISFDPGFFSSELEIYVSGHKFEAQAVLKDEVIDFAKAVNAGILGL